MTVLLEMPPTKRVILASALRQCQERQRAGNVSHRRDGKRGSVTVTPAEAGVQAAAKQRRSLDSGLRRNDEKQADALRRASSPLSQMVSEPEPSDVFRLNCVVTRQYGVPVALKRAIPLVPFLSWKGSLISVGGVLQLKDAAHRYHFFPRSRRRGGRGRGICCRTSSAQSIPTLPRKRKSRVAHVAGCPPARA